MSLFGTASNFGTGGTGVFGSTTTDSHNPMKDVEVTSPPDDSISSLAFSPPTMPGNFLIAGSWANDVRCWEVQDNGQTVPKAQQMHTGPVLDVCWSDDGSKVFTASCDKTAKMWDLNSNQAMQIAQHDGPIKSIHWIKAPTYSCVMTGSWDKTLKFWDTRSPNPMMSLQMPERCYCADVVYPMAVVATAERGLIVYQLENQPSEFRRIDSPLKHQHRCVAIFKDKQNKPTGFALGSIEGRVAIHYINPPNPAKDNFTFKCHRSNGTNTTTPQDIYAVNAISFHPVHGTLATVGSDGRFSFWDKDARTKLKTSEQLDQPITACCFNHNGNIFAYASSYDWSKYMNGSLEVMPPTPVQKDTTFTKIFVGGLPYHTTDASLRKYFEAFGDIDEAVVITDRQTGKSRGYGFVTMTDRGAAERACKDPNPIIDGRKANVNLAYLGAKPRSLQTGISIGVQPIHPALIQRQYGLAQPYIYPQAFVQPSLLLPTQVSASVSTSPYLDYSSAYAQYAHAAFDQQYPYAASPAGFLGYGYTTSPTASAGPAAATTAPATVHPTLPTATGQAPTFLHYAPQQHIQPERMQ
ncbi:hypothetical protein CRENBAI_006640 [Crenichthys baileyi]|uniref:Rae1 protein homolog n=1 Tax=Crenichthys baileyi TaxID=28760 RepID=A0AAV9RN91_9TELE